MGLFYHISVVRRQCRTVPSMEVVHCAWDFSLCFLYTLYRISCDFAVTGVFGYDVSVVCRLSARYFSSARGHACISDNHGGLGYLSKKKN